MLRIGFVTLFPAIPSAATKESILDRATKADLVSFEIVNPRDFTTDRHHKVDDSPYGGEPGMLIKAEPVARAIESFELSPGAAVISTDPAGDVFTQSHAAEFANFSEIIFLCGHYEGIDERVIERFATHRLSVGDYVLTGGELPALLMADAIVRLIPGVLGNALSLEADSFNNGILSAPNYTKPEEWRGMKVPEVLRNGNHALIAQWRRKEALKATRERRPDLFEKLELSKLDLNLIRELEETSEKSLRLSEREEP